MVRNQMAYRIDVCIFVHCVCRNTKFIEVNIPANGFNLDKGLNDEIFLL
jgi:hypothetical protein